MEKESNLNNIVGDIDIYLFDQLLKGTYLDCKTVLDAGCGNGRNLLYFLKNGYEVYGVDQNPDAIAHVKDLAAQFSVGKIGEQFMISGVEEMPFPSEKFNLVISSAVLHFAESLEHFERMLLEMWRVLKTGGYFFCRLASDIGIESSVRFIGNGRYILPDESERFLVNHEMLMLFSEKLGATLYEPIKTTNVHNMRCMTTWCLRK